MSAWTLAPGLPSATPVGSVVPALARRESVRLLRHPFLLTGFGLYVMTTGYSLFVDTSATTAFSLIDSFPSFYPGVFTILAGSLVASRDHRAGSGEILSPLPGRALERVLALCLACLAPAAVMLGLTLMLHGVYLQQGVYVDEPGTAHLVQGAVTVLGGSLFGVMVGTWAPTRSAALVALVVMVFANLWVNGDEGPQNLFGLSVGWGEWGSEDGRVWGGLAPGSPAWHVVYLLGLCGLAACAALLRVAHRRTPVLLASVVSLAVAVAGGIGQLP
jgi:hypothetical protein